MATWKGLGNTVPDLMQIGLKTYVDDGDTKVVTAVTGALSTVADAPAKAVLTSIIAAMVAAGIATNGTT